MDSILRGLPEVRRRPAPVVGGGGPAVAGGPEGRPASAALPPSAVFSVRSESFAGGQSVRVEIRNLSDREILDDHPDYPHRLNRAARELERTVRRMANAYNRDASDRHRTCTTCTTRRMCRSRRNVAAGPAADGRRGDAPGLPATDHC